MIADAKEIIQDYYGCPVAEVKNIPSASQKVKDLIENYYLAVEPELEIQKTVDFGCEEEVSGSKSNKRGPVKDLKRVRVKTIEKKDKPSILKVPKQVETKVESQPI